MRHGGRRQHAWLFERLEGGRQGVALMPSHGLGLADDACYVIPGSLVAGGAEDLFSGAMLYQFT